MACRNIKSLALGLLLALVATAASAQSGCGGQAAAGRVCGNAGASQGLPSLVTFSSLLDRAFGSTLGTVLNRGGGGWVASPNPSLGVNGGTGGAITLNGSSSGSVTIRVPAAAGGAIFQLPSNNGTAGFVLVTDGAGNTSWVTNSAGGTVQSVGLAMPGIFTVSGSPVTLTGTLTATLATQAANLVWAGPTTGAASAPTFRSLVGADLPNPSSSSLGGVQSFAAVSSQWIRQISTSGVPTASQPAFTDISGTLGPTQCPNPSASTLGCVQSLALQATKFISSISTSGVPSATQPNFTDLAGAATLAQLPSIGNNSILANNSGGTAIPAALSASNVLDMIGSTQGQILYRGASGWSVLSPGTAGFVLSSNGAGANPSYISVAGTGTMQTLTAGTGITLSSGVTCTTTCTVSLSTIATGTILANVTGGSAAPIANTPSAVLDVLGSTQGNILYRGASNWQVLAPGTNGQVLTQGASTPAWGSAGSVSNVTISPGSGIATSGTCTITTTGTCTVAVNAVIPPQGRLTLTSGVPVLTSSVTSATTVYYTPYLGNQVPIYDGVNFAPMGVAELSIALGANWTANSNWDVFIASDGGTIRACTGPAWTSDTARGVGAGTTELERISGILMNKAAVTCRYNNTTTFAVSADRGTYVGTFRTAGAGVTNVYFGGPASGGSAPILALWNMYNRALARATTADSGAIYTYASAVTRQVRASTENQINFVTGFAIDSIQTNFLGVGQTPAGGVLSTFNAIGFDTTTTGFSGGAFVYSSTAASQFGTNSIPANVSPVLGWHYISALEACPNGGTCTFGYSNQLTAQIWM